MPDFDQWPTKIEAAARLHVSTRTLERMCAAGTIESRGRRRPGKRAEVVYNPEDVERAAASVALTTNRPAVVPLSTLPPAEFLDPPKLLESWTAALKGLAARSAPPRPWMKLSEAAEYLGLSKALLKRLVASGGLPSVRDGRSVKVKREHLDQLNIEDIDAGGEPRGELPYSIGCRTGVPHD